MDLVTDSRALMMVRQLLDNTSATRAVFEQKPQKPAFTPSAIQKAFERVSPESQGVDSTRVADFLNAMRDDPTLDMHGVVILRNGKVLAEATFGAYDQSGGHITHSECKSITGLAVGILIGEGKLSLDDRIADIFGPRMNRINRLTHRNITIRHLLTMTSGVTFNEAGSVTETDWVKCFLESAVLKEPGTSFNYNSMNTYMLACAIRQITGEGLTTYLTPRLFRPLGIENFFWEKCPMGNEKGGWGLYILPEDIAKIGQMVLDGGRFEDRQIVPEDWIKEATRAQVETPKSLGDYNYGYQIWVGRNERSFLFNGMFGQNVLGFFDSGVLLVSNAGNNELFQQSSYYSLATGCFADAGLFGEGKSRSFRARARCKMQKSGCVRICIRRRRSFSATCLRPAENWIWAKSADDWTGGRTLPRRTSARPQSACFRSMRRRCRTTLPRGCMRFRLHTGTARSRSSSTKPTSVTF
jgi:CubicO group peptidase (beta-lactamase class C family)